MSAIVITRGSERAAARRSWIVEADARGHDVWRCGDAEAEHDTGILDKHDGVENALRVQGASR